jgi:hypothetical protein
LPLLLVSLSLVLVAYFLSTSFFAVGFFDFDLAKKKKRDATGLYLLA